MKCNLILIIAFIVILLFLDSTFGYLTSLMCHEKGGKNRGMIAHLELPCEDTNCVFGKGVTNIKLHFKPEIMNITEVEANVILVGWNDGIEYFGLTAGKTDRNVCQTETVYTFNTDKAVKCPLKEHKMYTLNIPVKIKSTWKPNSQADPSLGVLSWQLNIRSNSEFAQCNKITRIRVL